MEEKLRSLAGIKPTPEWLNECQSHLRQHNNIINRNYNEEDEVLHQILHTDLRNVVRYLHDNDDNSDNDNEHDSQWSILLRKAVTQSMNDTNNATATTTTTATATTTTQRSSASKSITLPNNFRHMVQIEELLDVSKNAEDRLSLGPASATSPTPIGNQNKRCLKLLISDGYCENGNRTIGRSRINNSNNNHQQRQQQDQFQQHFVALEVQPIHGLSVHSKAGIKIILSGPISIHKGILFLNPNNTIVLGGYIPDLIPIQKKAMERAAKVAGVGIDPTFKALVWNPEHELEDENDEGEQESGDVQGNDSRDVLHHNHDNMNPSSSSSQQQQQQQRNNDRVNPYFQQQEQQSRLEQFQQRQISNDNEVQRTNSFINNHNLITASTNYGSANGSNNIDHINVNNNNHDNRRSVTSTATSVENNNVQNVYNLNRNRPNHGTAETTSHTLPSSLSKSTNNERQEIKSFARNPYSVNSTSTLNNIGQNSSTIENHQQHLSSSYSQSSDTSIVQAPINVYSKSSNPIISQSKQSTEKMTQPDNNGGNNRNNDTLSNQLDSSRIIDDQFTNPKSVNQITSSNASSKILPPSSSALNSMHLSSTTFLSEPLSFSELRELLQQMIANPNIYDQYTKKTFIVPCKMHSNQRNKGSMNFQMEKNKHYKKDKKSKNKSVEKYGFVMDCQLAGANEENGALTCKLTHEYIAPFLPMGAVSFV
jgi:hypothetical protein